MKKKSEVWGTDSTDFLYMVVVCRGWSVDDEADEGGEEDEGDGGLGK